MCDVLCDFDITAVYRLAVFIDYRLRFVVSLWVNPFTINSFYFVLVHLYITYYNDGNVYKAKVQAYS